MPLETFPQRFAKTLLPGKKLEQSRPVLLALGKPLAAQLGMALHLCWPHGGCPEDVRWARRNIQGLHSPSLPQVIQNTGNLSKPVDNFSTYSGGMSWPLGLQC